MPGSRTGAFCFFLSRSSSFTGRSRSRTAFNRSLTPRRSVAFAHSSLDDLRFIKATFGATVNDAFLAGAKAQGLLQLKGHKSVGGMRASIYNAMPLAGVQALVAYMKDFAASHG